MLFERSVWPQPPHRALRIAESRSSPSGIDGPIVTSSRRPNASVCLINEALLGSIPVSTKVQEEVGEYISASPANSCVTTLTDECVRKRNTPDLDTLREEAIERLQVMVTVLNDPNTPDWMKTAAELELIWLARMAGMKIPDGTEH